VASQNRNVEKVIGRLATSAKGIVTRRELSEARLSKDEIDHRLRIGAVVREYPGVSLTVELDSYTYHASRDAWEQDRRREREAYARGDEFRRYTWGDVFKTPAPIMR
jgi:hypothetical protein